MRSAILAEAIILQAMEDLYDKDQLEGSLKFFTGEGFAECAALTGMGHEGMMGVLEAVSSIVSKISRPDFREICVSGDHSLLLLGRRTRMHRVS